MFPQASAISESLKSPYLHSPNERCIIQYLKRGNSWGYRLDETTNPFDPDVACDKCVYDVLVPQQFQDYITTVNRMNKHSKTKKAIKKVTTRETVSHHVTGNAAVRENTYDLFNLERSHDSIFIENV